MDAEPLAADSEQVGEGEARPGRDLDHASRRERRDRVGAARGHDDRAAVEGGRADADPGRDDDAALVREQLGVEREGGVAGRAAGAVDRAPGGHRPTARGRPVARTGPAGGGLIDVCPVKDESSHDTGVDRSDPA